MAKRRRKKKDKKVRTSEKSSNHSATKDDIISTEDEPVTFSNYVITPEPIKDYPPKIQKQVEDVHSILHANPHESIKRIETLMAKYPDVPVFPNYMAIAYDHIGDREKVNFWTEENYRRHPDYLFARINIAEMYLRKKQLDKIEKIFDGKFDLKLLYPDREEFHLTEASSFFGFAGKYFYFKDQRKQAERCYGLLKKICPDNPSTLYLKRVLYPTFFSRLLWGIVKYSLIVILFPIILLFLLFGKTFGLFSKRA